VISLKLLILIGVIDSVDNNLATVELNSLTYGAPEIAVLPVDAFPCNVREGKVFYIIQDEQSGESTIVCENDPGVGC